VKYINTFTVALVQWLWTVFINNLLIKIIVPIKYILSPYKLPCWLYVSENCLSMLLIQRNDLSYSLDNSFHLTIVLINTFIHCWYTNIVFVCGIMIACLQIYFVATTKQGLKWFHLLELHVFTPNCRSLVLTIQNIEVKCSTYWNYTLLHKKGKPFVLPKSHTRERSSHCETWTLSVAWDAKGRASKSWGLSKLTWQLAASSKLLASMPLHDANCVILYNRYCPHFRHLNLPLCINRELPIYCL
jgi:hypothetical protein